MPSRPDRPPTFTPTRLGIAGLTEQVIRTCMSGDIAFERVGDRCVARWTEGDETREAEVPLPPTAFRSILAQISARCDEISPGSLTPYGGSGRLPLDGDPSAVVLVDLVNNTDRQRLTLKCRHEDSARDDSPEIPADIGTSFARDAAAERFRDGLCRDTSAPSVTH